MARLLRPASLRPHVDPLGRSVMSRWKTKRSRASIWSMERQTGSGSQDRCLMAVRLAKLSARGKCWTAFTVITTPITCRRRCILKGYRPR
jgi:hypothetical protein